MKTKIISTVLDLNLVLKITFQGMVVAILFCFMNSEVIGQLKRFVNLSMGVPTQPGQSIAMTQYTVKLVENICCVNSSYFQLYNYGITSRIFEYLGLCRKYIMLHI